MKEIKNIIELKTNSKTKQLLFKTKYLVQINFTFELMVLSEGFSGNSQFCVRRDQLENLNIELDNIYSRLSGSTKIEDNDSDAFIEFSIEPNGNLNIQGQVGGTYEDHFIKFKLVTDQTCIPPLIQDFSILLLNKDK